jgi:hypothetical protein
VPKRWRFGINSASGSFSGGAPRFAFGPPARSVARHGRIATDPREEMLIGHAVMRLHARRSRRFNLRMGFS